MGIYHVGSCCGPVTVRMRGTVKALCKISDEERATSDRSGYELHRRGEE